jgi:exodeoxyribonuclease-3
LEFENYWFVNVYTPNAQNELKRIDTRLAWDERYREFLCELSAQKPVVTCGDFNVAHEEIDLKNPGPNRGNAGFSDEERESFGKLLDAGFVDTFRARHPDLAGAYSWWSYRFNARKNNAGWRIDYFLVSERIANKVTSASILNEVYGSDHCPVALTIEL